MHSSFIFATSALAFAALVKSQSFAVGGMGRFPCGAVGGGGDAKMCTFAAMTANQLCPPTQGNAGVVDGGDKQNGTRRYHRPDYTLGSLRMSVGAVPTSASCFPSPNGFFCGIVSPPRRPTFATHADSIIQSRVQREIMFQVRDSDMI